MTTADLYQLAALLRQFGGEHGHRRSTILLCNALLLRIKTLVNRRISDAENSSKAP